MCAKHAVIPCLITFSNAGVLKVCPQISSISISITWDLVRGRCSWALLQNY